MRSMVIALVGEIGSAIGARVGVNKGQLKNMVGQSMHK